MTRTFSLVSNSFSLVSNSLSNSFSLVRNSFSLVSNSLSNSFSLVRNSFSLASNSLHYISSNIEPCVKAVAILAVTKFIFKEMALMATSSDSLANPFQCIIICLTLGAGAGFSFPLYKSKVNRATIIGISLLANNILVPALFPTYCLSTSMTAFFNLIGCMIVQGY